MTFKLYLKCFLISHFLGFRSHDVWISSLCFVSFFLKVFGLPFSLSQNHPYLHALPSKCIACIHFVDGHQVMCLHRFLFRFIFLLFPRRKNRALRGVLFPRWCFEASLHISDHLFFHVFLEFFMLSFVAARTPIEMADFVAVFLQKLFFIIKDIVEFVCIPFFYKFCEFFFGLFLGKVF